MTWLLRVAVVVVLVGFVMRVAAAQDPYALRTAIGSEAYLWELRANQQKLRSKGTPKPNSAAPRPVAGRYTPPAPQALTQQTRNAIDYWGARRARATLDQIPRRPSFVRQASASSPSTGGKPFQAEDVRGEPTVSPYLQLFREEFEQTATNYHVFVRPRLDQQRETGRLRRQRESLRAARAQRPTTASTPMSGVHSHRFGNTGSFYSGWRR